MHIVLFHNHFNQLIAHHKGENGRRDRDNDRFGQGLQHRKNAAVPVLRGTSHIRRDFPNFGIHGVKQPRQVPHDTVNQDSFYPFPNQITDHVGTPPFPRPPGKGEGAEAILGLAVRDGRAG